jgi:carbamoyl-phosphate synthase small subunit
MQKIRDLHLVLEDGTVFCGKSFGFETPVAGEIVFNTAMTGYPESLTDPSYSGQILTITFPLTGNYGVPCDTEKDGLSTFFESEKIQASGLIVSDFSFEYSHWNAAKSLAEWLKENKTPAICGIDTRKLTKHLREHGVMCGKLVFPDGDDIAFKNPDLENQTAKASCSETISYGAGKYKIVLIDCGTKHSVIRHLLKYDVTVIRVPWDYDFTGLKYDGVLVSSGPGNPLHCAAAVENIRRAMAANKPVFGIGMGHQLLAMAGGAKTFKLKYGHRSQNQPVKLTGTNRAFITSQNHGFAVDDSTLSDEWIPIFENMNDGTNEGIRHRSQPWFSVQFQPESGHGHTDTEFLFDAFIKDVEGGSPVTFNNIIS